MQRIKQPIEREFEVFKQMFDASLQSSHPLLNEVITYIKQRSGKMMRPMLMLLIAKAFGEIGESTYHAASSLELLHTASLVHDDVVDESDKRRGQKSVNAVYDNLSNASLALDINSLKKISLLVYIELIISSSNLFDSALNCLFDIFIISLNYINILYS